MVSGSLRFAPPAGASVVVGLVLATRPLGPVPRAIALAAVASSWAIAVLVRSGPLRAHASVVAAIAAAIAAGQIDAGPVYGVACALMLLASLVSMRAARTPVDAVEPAARPRVRTLLALGASAFAVTAALVVGLPRLAAYVEQRINAMFGGDGAEQTAFSTTMRLGATRGMLQSDTIVMHVDGERPEYLRGAVYDRYAPPFWVTTQRGRERGVVDATSKLDEGTSVITLVRGAPNGEDMRWFLPANTCDLGVPSGEVEVDAFGVVRRGRAEDPQAIAFRTVGCASTPAPIAPPEPVDLDVPRRVRRALRPIAAAWTMGATTPRAKLAAIGARLGRFEYSLEVPRTTGLDPIVDFVTVHQAGHCELFASALALMARTEGIPARVVGGYRVSEVNPLTGRAVVRERHAHAWVEVWVDGAWHGLDPTPTSEAFAQTAGPLDHLGDVLSSALERMVLALNRLGLLGTAAVLAGVIGVLLVVRWLTGEVRSRADARRSGAAYDPPLPCFEALTGALAGSGISRDAAEPLESFAARVGALEPSWAADASAALLAYARLRYGGLGDEATVARDVDRVASTIAAARARADERANA